MAIPGKERDIIHKIGLLALTSAALAISFGTMCPWAKAQEQSALAAPIEGTWILTIHRSNGVSFTAFQTFAAGGVAGATGTLDRIPPPPISPLFGSWKRAGDNSYAVTLDFFIFDNAGNAVAMLVNHETLQMTDSNNVIGRGTAEICEPTGDHCNDFPLTITITGTRMIAQGAGSSDGK